MTDEPEILFRHEGPLGLVTLNRSKALNALTLNMIRAFQPQLEAWSGEVGPQAVAITGAGEKAFCAGGDVRAIYEAGKSGGSLTREFFREEYVLNRTIHRLPKPYVALVDGITMGGGVGLSIHGSHRVAGDRTTVAMPETAIGLFPDVGGSYFLPRLPGRTGLFLALTGARLKAADCCALGIASEYVPSERHDELLKALATADYAGDAAGTVDAVVAAFAVDPGPAPLQPHRETIDRCFDGGSIEEILENLHADGGDWARAQLELLEGRSPLSMKVTFEQLRRGATMDFEDCMTMEYRLSQACMAGHDFYEGIRSLLIDKDHAPVWQPAALSEVTEEMVAAQFAPLGGRDLLF